MVTDEPTRRRPTRRRLLRGLAASTVAMAAGTGVTVADGSDSAGSDGGTDDGNDSGAQSQCEGNGDSAAAVRAREQATGHLSTLEALSEGHPELVADRDVGTVRSGIRAGNEDFDLGAYCAAEQSYDRAASQAVGALREYLPSATDHHLSAVEGLVATARDRGGDSVAVQNFEERLADARETADAATEFGALVDAHAESKALQAAAKRELTPGLTDRLVTAVGVVVPAATGALGLGAGIAGGRWLADDGGSTEETTSDAVEPYPTPDDD